MVKLVSKYGFAVAKYMVRETSLLTLALQTANVADNVAENAQKEAIELHVVAIKEERKNNY
jgi:hypothetical protein